MQVIPFGARVICFGDDTYYLGEASGNIKVVNRVNHAVLFCFQHSVFPIQHLAFNPGSCLIAACRHQISLWDLEYVMVSKTEDSKGEDKAIETAKKLYRTAIGSVRSNDSIIAVQTTSTDIDLLSTKDLQLLTYVLVDDQIEAFTVASDCLYGSKQLQSLFYVDSQLEMWDMRGFEDLPRPVSIIASCQGYFCFQVQNYLHIYNQTTRKKISVSKLNSSEYLFAFANSTLAIGASNTCRFQTLEGKKISSPLRFDSIVNQIVYSPPNWYVLLATEPTKKDLQQTVDLMGSLFSSIADSSCALM